MPRSSRRVGLHSCLSPPPRVTSDSSGALERRPARRPDHGRHGASRRALASRRTPDRTRPPRCGHPAFGSARRPRNVWSALDSSAVSAMARSKFTLALVGETPTRPPVKGFAEIGPAPALLSPPYVISKIVGPRPRRHSGRVGPIPAQVRSRPRPSVDLFSPYAARTCATLFRAAGWTSGRTVLLRQPENRADPASHREVKRNCPLLELQPSQDMPPNGRNLRTFRIYDPAASR